MLLTAKSMLIVNHILKYIFQYLIRSRQNRNTPNYSHDHSKVNFGKYTNVFENIPYLVEFLDDVLHVESKYRINASHCYLSNIAIYIQDKIHSTSSFSKFMFILMLTLESEAHVCIKVTFIE